LPIIDRFCDIILYGDKMQRYFINTDSIQKEKIAINDSDFHHIKNVMRMKPGDEIIVTTFSGKSYKAVINEYTKSSVICKRVEELSISDNTLNVSLAQALIKRDNFELILQKATELGVKEIIPMTSSRTIIKIDDLEKKQTRYNAIVKEASEQSERVNVPVIRTITALESLPFAEYDCVMIAYERHDHQDLKSRIEAIKPSQKVLIVVGPEGGFTENEIGFLKEKGTLVSLGNTILRSETAAIYFISAFRLLWEGFK